MKTILYYTCNIHNPVIEQACRRHLLAVKGDCALVTVSLNEAIDFGDIRLVVYGKRSPEMMHKQILAGLEAITGGAVFMAESDVLYHPTHYDFRPARDDVYYYNEHTYKVDFETGQAVFYYTKQVSGLCADHALLLEHYRRRLARIEAEGRFDRRIGYEPGGYRPPRGIDNYPAERWMSEYPNVDIRHDKNITLSKWSLADFRNRGQGQGWKLVDDIPGWGRTKGRFREFLDEVTGNGHF